MYTPEIIDYGERLFPRLFWIMADFLNSTKNFYYLNSHFDISKYMLF